MTDCFVCVLFFSSIAAHIDLVVYRHAAGPFDCTRHEDDSLPSESHQDATQIGGSNPPIAVLSCFALFLPVFSVGEIAHAIAVDHIVCTIC